MKTADKIAWAYFCVHFFLEIVCFCTLYNHLTPAVSVGVAFVYDYFAFATQGIFGELKNKFPRVDLGLFGIVLVTISILGMLYSTEGLYTIELAVLALGNAMIHEAGAIATTKVCGGRLAHSAIFVSGGAFGVVCGMALGMYGISMWYLFIVIAVMQLVILWCNGAVSEIGDTDNIPNIVKPSQSTGSVLLWAFLITAVRSFMGYAIPQNWKSSLLHSFLAFFAMGFGKMAGGFLSDKFGARKLALCASIGCVPLVIFGADNMYISLLGLFCFSLTMCVTYGMALSVFYDNCGLAFGITTLGLFVGSLPVIFGIRFEQSINIILIAILSVICRVGFGITLKEKNSRE